MARKPTTITKTQLSAAYAPGISPLETQFTDYERACISAGKHPKSITKWLKHRQKSKALAKISQLT